MPKHTEIITRQLTLDDSPCGLCVTAHPGETLHTCKEHMHYHARALKDDAVTAYKASLSLIFAHVADIHMVMLNALSKRYGHSVADMLATVQQDPDWQNIYLHPTLKRMVYFEPSEPVSAPVLESAMVKPVRIKRAKKTEEPVSEQVIIKRPCGRPPKKQVGE
jgi:hypothetical protein